MYQLHAAPRSINRDDAGEAARTSKCKYTHWIEESQRERDSLERERKWQWTGIWVFRFSEGDGMRQGEKIIWKQKWRQINKRAENIMKMKIQWGVSKKRRRQGKNEYWQ